MVGVAAIMLAMIEQRRTGRGQLLDLSQAEATTCVLGEYVLAAQSAGRQPPRIGNRHPQWAPQGTYPCDGEDQWVSISVRSDADWQALCQAIGLTWVADLDLAERRRQHDELDRQLTAWTRQRDKFEAMRIIQDAGVSAGAVLDARELLENPQLAELGFFVDALDDQRQPHRIPGTPVAFDGLCPPRWRAAPGRGRDGRRILRELLELSDAEINALEDAGVLGRWPSPDQSPGR
jgi:crotonobetainyl-CoA:carnitine CoA-transferase CaiB-like acyl-CoA transferase